MKLYIPRIDNKTCPTKKVYKNVSGTPVDLISALIRFDLI